MRILFWPGTFWPVIGGIEVHAAKLLPALRARGYEFIVITTHSSPDLPTEARYQGIPIFRLPFWEGHNDLERLIEIRQRVAHIKGEFAPDLVHRNGVGIGDYFHLSTAKTNPCPLLVTLCNDLKCEEIDRDTSLSSILRQADWVTSVSGAALEQARALVPEISDKSSVIYNGLEVPDEVPREPPSDVPRLLCLGRLAPQKGFDLALQSFANVVKQYPQSRLQIAGDGPDLSALKQQVEALGLLQNVDFLGWVIPEDVPALINAATMVLMPSRWEGHPLVAVQASQMARPIIATRVGGLPEVVEHGVTGILIDAGDTAALTAAIVALLEDPAAAAVMGKEAKRKAQEEFNWEHCVDAYDELYSKLILESRFRQEAPAGRRPVPR